MIDDPLAALEAANAAYQSAQAAVHTATENQTRWYDLLRGARDPAGRAKLAGAIDALGLTSLDEALAIAPRLDEARATAEVALNAASLSRQAAGHALHVAGIRDRQAADAAHAASEAARQEDERRNAAEVAAWLSAPAAVRALKREMADQSLETAAVAAVLARQ